MAFSPVGLRTMEDFVQQLIANLKSTTPLEAVAVAAGIASVYFSRRESIWVYPTGLVNTVIYIYISLKAQLVGEACVNFYYTAMSVWGVVLLRLAMSC